MIEKMTEEATDKLGLAVTLDARWLLQAFDTGGRARALVAIFKALAGAKKTGIASAQALKLVDCQE